MMRRLVAGALTWGLATGSALCLTDEEIFREFRFNLINPGARSLALGGAFTSLADDATAAQANPAGLGYLLKPEYFIEVRAVDTGGDVAVLREDLPVVETAVGSGSNLEDIENISFASVVLPFTGPRLTIGFSRQEVLRVDNDTLNGFFFTFVGGSGFFATEGAGSIDVRQSNLNASIGVRLDERDRLAVGASVSFGRIRVSSEVENLIIDTNGNITGTPVLEPTPDLRTTIDDSDSAVGFSVGALYRPFEALSFGLVYRKAPKFSVTEEIEPGLDTQDVQTNIGDEFQNEFNMPDSYGIGVSWRPRDTLTFAMDIERIEYSDLVDGYVAGLNALTDFDAEFTVDDAIDYHLGGEYVSLLRQKTIPLALRAGVFTRSDNTIRATDTGTDTLATESAFPEGDDEVHGTLGIGIGWRRYKVDLAADLAESSNEFLVSFIMQGK